MNLDDIKKMSDDPDLIPGIYNYCDRWCERCYLSSRCLNFKMEMHATENRPKSDISNKEFWNELSQTFSMTMELLKEIAEQQGLDFEEIKKQSSKVTSLDDPEIENHRVNALAKEYYASAKQWLEKNGASFINRAKVYKKLAEQDIDVQEHTNKIIVIRDLYEIISWYHSMILVKAKRAVTSLLEDEHEDEIQNDANGTAKVVLNCIDRSMFAWNGILNHMPDQEDDALNNLAILQNLKAAVLHFFPKAEQFIRPGFDEPNS